MASSHACPERSRTGGSQSTDPLPTLRRRLWIERAVSLVLLGFLLALCLRALPTAKRVCLIAVDGRPAAVVETRPDADRILAGIRAASGLPPGKVSFRQQVTFHKVPAAHNPVQSDSDAMAALASNLDLITRAAAIFANGEVVIALPSQDEAVKTLFLLIRDLRPPAGAGIPTYFKEQVRVQMADVPPTKLAPSADEAFRKIVASASPRAEYRVKPGDSAWKIAGEHNLPLSRLAQANPDLNLDHLRAGDRLKLPGPLPPITVVAQKDIFEEVGEGPAQVTQKVRITYENGVEVKREIIGRRPHTLEALRRPPVTAAPPRPTPSSPPPAERRAGDIWHWKDEIPQ